MSFKGLDFIRQWVKEHIYKPRVKGSAPRPTPALVATFREDVKSSAVEIEEVEEEVGSVETAIDKALKGRPLEEPK